MKLAILSVQVRVLGGGGDGGGGDGKIPRFDEILSTDAVGACNLIELLEECD